jgi:D-alanyl-D-alanine carboxypeptidase
MSANIPSFIAGIAIVFSVFLGTHAQDNKITNKDRVLLSSGNNATTNKNYAGSATNNSFESKLASLVALLNPPQTPNLPVVPPVKLSLTKDIPATNLKVNAGISINEKGKILYAKNINQQFSIASITKLMTALVVLDQLNPDSNAEVSKNAVDTYGEMGNLVPGEKLTVRDLLYIMLIDSSNDAAIALAENVEKNGKNFVELMNQKTKNLHLDNSSFADPSGLNPNNLSTAYDLTVLMNNDLMNPLIEKIISTEKIDVASTDGKNIHHLVSTNELLGKVSGMEAGKTGYTEEAGECLIVAVKNETDSRYFISNILGAGIGMRFIEMEKLIKWTKQVAGWQN